MAVRDPARVLRSSSISIDSSLYASGSWTSTYSQKSAGYKLAAAAMSISFVRASSVSKAIEKKLLFCGSDLARRTCNVGC